MKLFNLYKVAIILTPVLFLFPGRVQAGSEITIRPLSGFTNLSQLINTLLAVAMFGGALLCFTYLMLGAYKYLTAGDNAANTAAARQTLINAVIGLILLSLIYVIFQIVIRIVPGLDKWFGIAT